MRYIYIDESRISQNCFQLFGSLWYFRKNQKEFYNEYWKLWDKHFPNRNSELKWTKVSKKKLPVYKEFIDLFAQQDALDFRCVILDTQTIDYQQYHNGDKELGFYKFLFFFLSRNVEKDYKFKEIDGRYQIFLDSRRMNDTIEVGRLSDLKNVLSSRLYNTCPQISISNVEAIKDSRTSPEVQIVDVLLGAVGYVWEGYQTSEPKLALIEYIEKTFGLKLGKQTPYLTEKINIWKFKFNSTQKAP